LRTACNTVVWYLRAATLPGADAQTLRAQALEGLEWLMRVQRPEGLFPYPDLSADAEAWLEACAESGRDAATCRDALPRALELGALGRARWETAGRPEASTSTAGSSTPRPSATPAVCSSIRASAASRS
jgi:hypothetical protein